MKILSALQICQKLICIPSVTPDTQAITLEVAAYLTTLGFRCQLQENQRQDGKIVTNLIADIGNKGPRLGFAGHLDVVPYGNLQQWQSHPTQATIVQDRLYGRGAVDMKGAVAAWLGAIATLSRSSLDKGSMVIFLTGDEEEGSPEGMPYLLKILEQQQLLPDICLVGEPSCDGFFGQGIRLGRRGSLHLKVVAEGKTGHVARPHLAHNALHDLLHFLEQLQQTPLPHEKRVSTIAIPETSLQILSLDAPNTSSNMIPEYATARINLRFHPTFQADLWLEEVEKQAKAFGPAIEWQSYFSAQPYLSPITEAAQNLQAIVKQVTQHQPQFNAGGGTSDARFIARYCPCLEFGLVGDSAHQTNESFAVEDLLQLTTIYRQWIEAFFH